MRHQSPYQHPNVIVGVALALVMAVTGMFAPFVVPHDPEVIDPSSIMCPPLSCAEGNQSYVLGTDQFGRDILSRIVTSLRVPLYAGLLGSLSGPLAAWLMIVVRSMRTTGPDPNIVRPLLGFSFYGVAILTYLIGVFLSLVIIVIGGSSLKLVIVCAGAFSSILPMALVYEYARWDSASSSRVLLASRRGVALYPVGFALAFLMGLFIESSLSFLGAGVPSPSPSLGIMIGLGYAFEGFAGAWLAGFPLGIVLVAMGAFLAIVFPVSSDFIPSSQAQPIGSPPMQAGAPAGFWIRLVAWSIDSVLQLVLIVIFGRIFGGLGQSGFVMALLLVAFLAIITWAYVISPGKRLLGLFILRPNGSRVGLGRKVFRSMISLLTFGIGHSMIVFRQDKRGLHDLFADTVVVRGGGESPDLRQ